MAICGTARLFFALSMERSVLLTSSPPPHLPGPIGSRTSEPHRNANPSAPRSSGNPHDTHILSLFLALFYSWAFWSRIFSPPLHLTTGGNPVKSVDSLQLSAFG